MKLLSPNYFLLILGILFLNSCEKDNETIVDAELIGQWKLTELRTPVAFDINQDGIANTNLLLELDCKNEELLSFDALGGVQSVYTYNYDLKTAQTSDGYIHQVDCGEELLAWATDYVSEDGGIYFLERVSRVKGNKLYTTYENSLDIHSSDFSEVIESLEVTRVYTKVGS